MRRARRRLVVAVLLLAAVTALVVVLSQRLTNYSDGDRLIIFAFVVGLTAGANLVDAIEGDWHARHREE